jgi:glyoxylase-like metal-dependent hydrolase (beta-lactamase superfamily II)
LVVAIPFVPRIDDAPYAVTEQMTPLVQRVIANNPSKFSYHGTGTYILGTKDVVVIDPGPELDSHRDALHQALVGRNVVGIVVTHCHSDHSPLTAWLHAETNAMRYAIGPHQVYEGFVEEDDHDASEDDPEEKKNESDEERETIDLAFAPDVAVKDGENFLTTSEFSLTAVATPGHTSNHLSVAMDVDRALFTGDHVMGRPRLSLRLMAICVNILSQWKKSLRDAMQFCGQHMVVLLPIHNLSSLRILHIVSNVRSRLSNRFLLATTRFLEL